MPSVEPIRPTFKVEVLSTDQLAEIKSATLHILEHVGVRFPSDRALQVFAEHGVHVDEAPLRRQRCIFDSLLSEECDSGAP